MPYNGSGTAIQELNGLFGCGRNFVGMVVVVSVEIIGCMGKTTKKQRNGSSVVGDWRYVYVVRIRVVQRS